MNATPITGDDPMAGIGWKAWASTTLKALSQRERATVVVAAVLLAVAVVWLVVLGPAWRVVNAAPQHLEALDGQLQDMQRLARQAQQWRSRPALPPGQAEASLSAATTRLGDAARLSIQGERVVLNLRQVQTEALQAWLAEARRGARAQVQEADLVRAPNGGDNGSITLALGGRNP
ncbi:MAG: type II secretion system protein GspM [Aquabacterium sp.]